MEEQEKIGKMEIAKLNARKNILEEALKDALDQQYQQTINKFSYSHILKRMELDLRSIKSKIINLEYSLEHKTKLVEEEETFFRKIKEEQIEAKRELHNLMDLVD